jgi:hypothetical protein
VRTPCKIAISFNPCNKSESGAVYDYIDAKKAAGEPSTAAEDESV